MPVIPTSEVPSPAMIMTLNDVCDFQWGVVETWNNPKDVWSFTRGVSALSIGAAISGGWMAHSLRRSFKVSKRNALVVLLPLTLVPPSIIYGLQHMWVMRDIFLYDMKECIICPLLKSTISQVGLSIAYPMVVGSALSWGLAYHESAVLYNVPHYTEFAKAANYLYVHNRPLVPRIAMLFFAQTILAQSVTYYQYLQWKRLKDLTLLTEEDSKEVIQKQTQIMLQQDEKLLQRKVQQIEEERNKMIEGMELLQ